MVIIFDSIIWSLQKIGGISLYWAELLSGLHSKSNLSLVNIEFNNQNIIRKEYSNRLPENKKHRLLIPALARLESCRIPKAYHSKNKKAIYHSSFYRPPKTSTLCEVVTVHDMIPERFGENVQQNLQAWIKRRAVVRADIIICISKNTRDDLLNIVPTAAKKKIVVVYNGVSKAFKPLNNTQLPESFRNNMPYALFVGRRGGYKNFVSAVKAVSLIKELSLVAVGGGPLSSDEKSLINGALKGRFRHLIDIDENFLNQLYNGAFCLIYPSMYEGFGLPVVEAMRAGCPVVALNRSSISELVKNAFSLVESEAPEALSERMRALENLDERSKVVTRGQERAQIFTWDKCVQDTLSVYRSLT